MMAVAKAPMDNSMTMDYTNATDLTQNDDDQAQQELLQEAMGDNLEMMLAVIMKIREDKDYAKSIYADCPRLQHFLDLHPDLRPVFEDQKLVLINFEQVYRKAGGVLPEDKPNRIRNCIVCIVKHPLFKLLRFLLLIKKIYTCVTGTGVALLKQCICSCFAEKATQAAGENLANVDDGGVANAVGDPTNAANSEALNRAADYMSGTCV